jgi:4-amino-4-deoxy-L-arabinose transferase-like glycosyltransferase
MSDLRRFTAVDLALFLAVLAAAAGARAAYLGLAAANGTAAGPIQVQDAPPVLTGLPPGTSLRGHEAPTELDALAHNLHEHRWFGSLAPLAAREEQTAHVAPGYPWLLSRADRWLGDQADRGVRWAQCGLGTLTAVLYFLFARRAFQSRLAGALAGAFCALHPFWVVNTAEINDGVLATFLLAASIWLGSAGGASGEPFTSLLYGLALAALCLVRAAFFPFAGAALLWFLLRSRDLRRGWLCGLLAFLGFVNGLAAWTFRNYQVFHDVFPIVDSTYYHLWVGNNPRATGGPLSEEAVRDALPPGRAEELEGVAQQPDRYAALGRDVLREVRANPAATLERRLRAGLCFLVGEKWLSEGRLWRGQFASEDEGPAWLAADLPVALAGFLLGMFVLGGLGWRWTYGWRYEAMPSSLAVIFVPLPYLLSHAGAYHGPRLPLDGVLLTYAAFAVACLVPGNPPSLFEGAPPAERR